MTPQAAPTPQVETLWERVVDRDGGAFEELQHVTRKVCPAILRRPWVPAGEMERLLQDVLVSVWEFAGKQNEKPRNLRGFLQWRARGVLSAFRRELVAAEKCDPLESCFDLPDGSAKMSDGVQLKEMSQAFKECRKELSPDYATVWNARFEKGMTTSEASHALGVGRETVALRLHRAKTMLLQCLQGKGVLA